jgi:hypothetical protein
MRWRKLTVLSLALGLIVSALYIFSSYKGIYNSKSAVTDFGDAEEVCNDYLNPDNLRIDVVYACTLESISSYYFPDPAFCTK